ncbi:dihydropteroate synthase [Rhodococcus sp. LB1]|uniref:dihydropteroate synthase n=1 Tax=Rhodococcus sp. LB1 TaxID=1807499 RepID=UPI000AE7B659|nr:dihydropteroate synthase [Rhodococcus sp. LB1]
MTIDFSPPRYDSDLHSAPSTTRPGTEPLKVMGILNLTPDSFWAGSRYAATEEAIAAGEAIFEAGAWAVDIGGESTRPGAVPVSPDAELERIAPIISALATKGRVSVDTRHDVVAEEAVRLGASIVNDVSGTLHNVAGRLSCGYVGMHSHTVPVSIDGHPVYDDVVTEVSTHLTGIAAAARVEGVGEMWIDPGIGFGKSLEDNVELLRRLPSICALGVPVLLGVSRKSFIGKVTGREVGERLPGSLALIAPAWSAGVDVIRVHDVPQTLDTIAMLEAVWGATSS